MPMNPDMKELSKAFYDAGVKCAQEYQDRALRTLCPAEQIDLSRVPSQDLNLGLLAIIDAARLLDKIKKTAVYGKPYVSCTCFTQESPEASGSVDVQIVHAIIGIITEAGELAEALYKALFSGEELDIKNLCEESGDIDWYQALLDSRTGYNQQQRWADNAEKLSKRYTKTSDTVAFTSKDAIDREVEKELDHIRKDQP